jgi:toxin ParE1/3/4
VGYRIALTRQAIEDLADIANFLGQRSTAAALKIGDELVELAFSLDEFPFRGVAMRNRPEVRKMVHRHYLIIFQVNEPARIVKILRFWDGRQDPAGLTLP